MPSRDEMIRVLQEQDAKLKTSKSSLPSREQMIRELQGQDASLSADAPEEKPWYDISKEGVARGAIDAIPIVAGIGGAALAAPVNLIAPGVASIVGGGLGYAGGKELADTLRNRFLGDEATSVDPIEQAKRVAGNVRDGALMEMGGQVTGKAIGYAGGKLASGAKRGGEALRKVANKIAKNATGATGAQVSKMADDAGNQLLDRGLMKFGDDAGKIADRTGAAMDEANAAIDGALKSLDAKGVTASADNVVKELQEHISTLEKDSSQAGVVRKLKGIVDDIIQTGESNIPVSLAEKTKRGFNKMAGNWVDPEVGQAGKQAYRTYRNEVEGVATAADPDIAAKFIEGKKTHGLLAPIQEAAGKRAATNSQQQIGNLVDLAAGAYGLSDPDSMTGKAALAVAGRRFVLPRVAASSAVMTNAISKMLLKTPKMATLFQKNPQAFNSLVGQMEKRLTSGVEGAAQPPSFQKTAGDDGEYVAKSEIKGENKWALDGLKKLMEHDISLRDPKVIDELLSSSKGKRLLVAASDLKPGSRAIEKIGSEIQKLSSGVLESGNIDLKNRPRVKNADGTISTVRSIGVNIDGKEVLIPTVSEDGRILNERQAIEQYKRTGKHLGKFKSVAASNSYAKKLHEEQAKMIEGG